MEHLIRNNGFTGTGVGIPFHVTTIFYLNRAGAEHFLEQHPPSVFFIRKTFVDRFLVPLGSAVGEKIPCRSRPTAIFPRLFPDRYCSNIQHITLSLIRIHH